MRLPLKRRSGILAFIALKYLGLDPFEYRDGRKGNRIPRDVAVHDDAELMAAGERPDTPPPQCWPSNDQLQP